MQVFRSALSFCGLALLVVGMTTCAKAVDINFGPEIDPGSIGSAIALFAGSVMFLTSRRQAK